MDITVQLSSGSLEEFVDLGSSVTHSFELREDQAVVVTRHRDPYANPWTMEFRDEDLSAVAHFQAGAWAVVRGPFSDGIRTTDWTDWGIPDDPTCLRVMKSDGTADLFRDAADEPEGTGWDWHRHKYVVLDSGILAVTREHCALWDATAIREMFADTPEMEEWEATLKLQDVDGPSRDAREVALYAPAAWTGVRIETPNDRLLDPWGE